MFPWLKPNLKGTKASAERHAEVIAADLRSCAATLYRLGYTQKDAAARLDARVEWEHAPRPAALDRAAIKKLVKEVFDRRPS